MTDDGGVRRRRAASLRAVIPFGAIGPAKPDQNRFLANSTSIERW